MASKPWPAWWRGSSSPVDLLQGSYKSWGVTLFSVGFVLILLTTGSWRFDLYHWARHGLLPMLLGLAAMPWVGVWMTAWRHGNTRSAAQWLRTTGVGLPSMLASAVPLVVYFEMPGLWIGSAIEDSLVHGLVALVVSIVVSLIVWERRSLRSARRALRALVVGVPLLVVVVCFERLVRVREAPYPDAMPGSLTAFGITDPWSEYALAAMLVWGLALMAHRRMQRQMGAWRALAMVEATVDKNGLVAVEGRHLRTEVKLAAGTKAMVETAQHLGASYREDAGRAERMVVADAAQWTAALDAAELHVTSALGQSLAFVGGMLFLEIVAAW